MTSGWVEQASSVLLAALVALMLWFVSSEDVDPVETMDRFPAAEALPIEVRSVPEDRAYFDLSDVDARVTLRGLASGLEIMEPGDVALYVDLEDAAAEAVTATLPVKWDCPTCLRRGVRVTEPDTEEVTLHLGATATHQRVVDVEVMGAPPSGYVVTTTQTEPTQVTLSGAAPQLSRVSRVVAEIEDLGNARSDVAIEDVPVRALDADGVDVGDIQLVPPAVDVVLGVQRRGIEVSVTPGVEGLQADGYYISRISVDPQIVQLSGDQAALTDLETMGTLTASVDITGAAADVVETVPLPLPGGVTALNAPDGVTVTIGVTPLPGTVRLVAPVRTRGIGQGLEVDSISPASIEVLVGGPQASLGSLDAEDVVVVADLSDLDEGRHTVALAQPRVPTGFFVRSVNPSVVDVVIVERQDGG